MASSPVSYRAPRSSTKTPWGGRQPPEDEQTAVEETTDLANGLRETFRPRDRLYQAIDEVLHQELAVEIPTAYRKTAMEVKTPLAIHMSNTVAAALTVNPLTVQFRPIQFGDIAQQNATLRERFFEASWLRQEQESTRQLLRLFMYALCTKGSAVLKTVERANQAWSDYTTQANALEDELAAEHEFDQDARDRIYNSETNKLKLQAPYPIATTDVLPETFYYNKNENGFTACVEVKSVPYLEALERFGTGMDKSGNVYRPDDWSELDPRAMGLARSTYADTMRGTDRMLTVVEAWDWQVCNVICIGPGQASSGYTKLGHGTLVRSYRHGYGDPVLHTLRGPYFQALGITTNSRQPAKEGLGVLYGFLDLFPLLDSLLTVQANAAMMTGFPAFKRVSTPGSVPGLAPGALASAYGTDQREQADPIRLGTIYPYDIAPVDQPKSGVSLTELLTNVQNLVQLVLPSVVQGVMASDQASGYALNQAAYLARLAWDPIVKNAQTALGDRTGWESWLIEHRIGEDVYAWAEDVPHTNRGRGRGQQKAGWVGIGPEDLSGVHRYQAHLDISTPSDDVVKTRAIAEKLQLQLMTWEDAVREMGSNPDEVEKSNLLRMMKQSPAIMEKLIELTNQKLGTIQAQQMASTPGMPSPAELMGAPQGPPGMPPGGPGPGAGGQQPGALQIPGQPPQAGPGPPANPAPSPGAGMPVQPGPSPVPVQVGPGVPGGPPGPRPGIPGQPMPPPRAF